MINLEWLRTFSVIFECRNITEASKILYMTQPGVSKHLSALEHHIGKKLFDRTTRKVTPTEYGKFLYTQVIASIQQLEKVEHYASNRTKKERSAIVIGCTSDFFKRELLDKIYQFDMYIVVRFGTEQELIEALEQDKIQLLLGVKRHDTFEHQFTLTREEFLTLIANTALEIPQTILQHKKLQVKWLQQQIWFSYENELHDVKQFWEYNFNTTPKIVPRYILPSYLDISIALQKNKGVGIVPEYMCQTHTQNEMFQIPFPELQKVPQKIYCAHTLKNDALKEIKVFKELMKY